MRDKKVEVRKKKERKRKEKEEQKKRGKKMEDSCRGGRSSGK
jgi:hypothetical protein